MTVKKMIGMTVLVATTMSHAVMATPLNTETELTKVLETISSNYIEADQIEEVQVADGSQLSEETLAAGTLTTIIADEAKIRDEASEDADIINYLKKGDQVVAIEMIDNWYFVKNDEVEGFVYKTQVNQEVLALIPYTRTEENQLPTEASEAENYLGEEVVSYAKQFLGNPYVYGGNSLTRGVDCSGFTSQVYKKFDISLQRSSRSQYASNGYKVSKSELLPGDLVFYGFNGDIDHVALYAGNGEIIHASSPKTGIKMSKLEYGKPIIGIKRVIN